MEQPEFALEQLVKMQNKSSVSGARFLSRLMSATLFDVALDVTGVGDEPNAGFTSCRRYIDYMRATEEFMYFHNEDMPYSDKVQDTVNIFHDCPTEDLGGNVTLDIEAINSFEEVAPGIWIGNGYLDEQYPGEGKTSKIAFRLFDLVPHVGK